MRPEGPTPVESLGLSPELATLLKSKGVKNFDDLCCVTMGDLETWGIDKENIPQILALART